MLFLTDFKVSERAGQDKYRNKCFKGKLFIQVLQYLYNKIPC